MLKPFTKITAQNFEEAVEHSYLLNKKMTSLIRTRKIILPLGSIFFSVFSLLIILGAFSSILPISESVAFAHISFIPTFWNAISGLFSSITGLWYLQLVMTFVLIYFISFVVCGIAALIIFLLTKVESPDIKGSTAERAKQLCLYSCKIPESKQSTYDIQARWRSISGIIFVSGILAFAIYLLVALTKQESAPSSVPVVALIGEEIIGLLIGLAILYFVYTLFHRLHTLTTKCFYNGCDKWNSFAHEARSYWISVDPAERKKIKKESKKAQSTNKYSSTTYSGGGYSTVNNNTMSRAEKQEYIDKNCHGMFSYTGIETIDNDPNLTPSQKEDLKTHLKIWGD